MKSEKIRRFAAKKVKKKVNNFRRFAAKKKVNLPFKKVKKHCFSLTTGIRQGSCDLGDRNLFQPDSDRHYPGAERFLSGNPENQNLLGT